MEAQFAVKKSNAKWSCGDQIVQGPKRLLAFLESPLTLGNVETNPAQMLFTGDRIKAQPALVQQPNNLAFRGYETALDFIRLAFSRSSNRRWMLVWPSGWRRLKKS